jgi:charged multivesicular body protein 6
MKQLESISLDKLQSYYSNFTLTNESLSRHSHKLEFWKNILSSTLHSSDSIFILDSNTLEQKFTYKGLRPLCFPSLLSQWEKDKIIIPVEEFSVKVSLMSVIFSYFNSQTKSGKYIFMPHLLQAQETYFTEIFKSDVQEEERITLLSKKDLEILLKFWEFKGIITRENVDGIKVIKKGKEGVNEVEKGIVKLKNTLEKVEKSILELENSVLELKNADKTVHLLYKIKVQKEKIHKLQISRDNLQGILQEIYKISLNKEIIQAMALGSKSLNVLLKEIGQQDISQVMEQVEENLEKSREIEEIISGDFKNEDMEEVEKELEELLLQEESLKENLSFPEIPDQILPDKNLPEKTKKIALTEK